MDKSKVESKRTFEEWIKALHIKCQPDNRFFKDKPTVRYTKKVFFNKLTLIPVFHIYRSKNLDHCTCAYAQYYLGKFQSPLYEPKYIKGYKVALLERRRH